MSTTSEMIAGPPAPPFKMALPGRHPAPRAVAPCFQKVFHCLQLNALTHGPDRTRPLYLPRFTGGCLPAIYNGSAGTESYGRDR